MSSYSPKVSFRKGQFVFADIVEQVDLDSLIVNFQGQLLQIKNRSNQSLSVGSQVRLVVNTVDPLSFSLAPERSSSKRGLNIQV